MQQGWQKDPTGRHQERWYDGSAWSSQVRTFGVVKQDDFGGSAGWAPIREHLKTYSLSQKKPVLFTEWGYLSVDGCGWRNWELEKGIDERNINEQAQANCMEAMLATFQPEDWWAGSFLWKWFPNMRGHEGYPERDYTPQGKLAEKTLRKWYK